jgi:hypothetical protein
LGLGLLLFQAGDGEIAALSQNVRCVCGVLGAEAMFVRVEL